MIIIDHEAPIKHENSKRMRKRSKVELNDCQRILLHPRVHFTIYVYGRCRIFLRIKRRRTCKQKRLCARIVLFGHFALFGESLTQKSISRDFIKRYLSMFVLMVRDFSFLWCHSMRMENVEGVGRGNERRVVWHYLVKLGQVNIERILMPLNWLLNKLHFSIF